MPRIGNDIFEIITLPRQEKSGLQVGLTVLLEATVEKCFGSAEEGWPEQLDLLSRWFYNTCSNEEDGVQQQ